MVFISLLYYSQFQADIQRSVAGRAIQNSFWPEFLRSDTARNRGVRWDVRFLVRAIQWIKILVAIAGTVTPLGLYSVSGPGRSFTPDFQYAQDFSPFGQATPPRSELGLARLCFAGPFGYRPCPYTKDVVIETSYGNGTGDFHMPYEMSTEFPQKLREIYSSGTAGFASTISNYLDIEWRQYTQGFDKYYNNGTMFLVGAYRQMQSLVLTNKVTPVEGLIVDAKNGGVGFRNHTLPIDVGEGAYWDEDLLYIQPETVCVNTNLTIDFTVPTNVSSTGGIASDLRLVDRGGTST